MDRNTILVLELFVVTLIIIDQAKALASNRQARVVTISTVDDVLIDSTLNKFGIHVPVIVVNISTVDDIKFTLDLHLNRDLLSAGYREKVCTEHGDYYLTFNEKTDFCFYIGTVRGFPGSTASLSTCDQIRGFFVADGNSYSITPLEGGSFKEAVVELDENTNFTCGVFNSLPTIVKRINKRSLYDKIDRKTRFIELYAISDTTHFKQFSSPNEATQRIKEVVNAANALYNSVDMYLILVGTEVWQTPKIRVIENNSSATLDNFYDYKKYTLNDNSPSHDNACLFLAVTFPNGVIGLAQMESMCSTDASGNFITDREKNGFSVSISATLLTHEIGHNMGLVHDNELRNCPCADVTGTCIMSSSLSLKRAPTTFSSCSKSYLVDKRSLGLDLCLFNIPDLMNLTGGVSTCGNGIIEQGEDCDCGGLPTDVCNKDCCKSNCKLVGSAACAMGMCCDVYTCNFITANTICRSAEDSCDIPELCDGRSAFCPTDSYKHNGLSCNVAGKPAFCSKGRCQNHESQCQKIWNSSATESPGECYDRNKNGNISGSCKINLDANMTFMPCDQKDIKCGQLFCVPSPPGSVETTLRSQKVYYHNTLRSVCAFVIFDFGKQVVSPGFVPDGAVCGNAKMCVNQSCVDVANVLLSNPCSSVCQDGVCDNTGQCRCTNGLVYPSCSGETFTKFIPSTTTKVSSSFRALRVENMVLSIILLNLFKYFLGYH